MMVSALNLFKDYVSNSFMLGMGLLTAMIVFYLLTFFLIHLWERDGAVDKKLLPVAVRNRAVFAIYCVGVCKGLG